MNYQQYKDLPSAEKIRLWERLKASEGWILLEELLMEETTPSIGKDVSKDEYLFRMIRKQAIEEVFRAPKKQIFAIKAVSRQSDSTNLFTKLRKGIKL